MRLKNALSETASAANGFLSGSAYMIETKAEFESQCTCCALRFRARIWAARSSAFLRLLLTLPLRFGAPCRYSAIVTYALYGKCYRTG